MSPIDTRFDVPRPLPDFLPETPEGPRTVAEPARDVPVVAECDVVVLGGGTTGACAAAAAARGGRSVVLVERYGFLGGMATAGDVIIWHSDLGTDRRTPVIGGLPIEIVDRLDRLDAVERKSGAGDAFAICPETTKLVLDDLVIGSGARLLLHARLAGAIRDGRRVTAAIVETKSGRGAILADTFIDCTGDADLLRFAGAETHLGDPQGRCQAPTLCWRVARRPPDAAGLNDLRDACRSETMDYNGEEYSCFLWGRPSVWDPSEHMLAGTRVLNVNAADARDLTRAEIEARYQMRWVNDRARRLRGWEETYLVDIAAQLGIRETYRAVADHELTREELLDGTFFPDAVAQGTYPVDIHLPDRPGITFAQLNGTTRHISGDGEVTLGRWDGADEDAPHRDTLCYHVPYRSLIPRDMDNVLVAGRCIGADHEAAGAIRVMINCMQFGQAAGTAAAFDACATNVRDVPADALREKLIADGVPLRDG